MKSFNALKQITLSILGFLCVTVLWNSGLAAQEQFQVVSMNLLSSIPVGTTQYNYTYRVEIRNEGSAARGVTAIVTSTSERGVAATKMLS